MSFSSVGSFSSGGSGFGLGTFLPGMAVAGLGGYLFGKSRDKGRREPHMAPAPYYPPPQYGHFPYPPPPPPSSPYLPPPYYSPPPPSAYPYQNPPSPWMQGQRYDPQAIYGQQTGGVNYAQRPESTQMSQQPGAPYPQNAYGPGQYPQAESLKGTDGRKKRSRCSLCCCCRSNKDDD